MKKLGSGLVTSAAVIVALVIALGLAQHFSLLPHLSNPVKETTVDRTGPAVLKSLEDLSDYHGSTGEFEVTVDLEKDVKFIPSALAGEHTTYDAIGSVDGVVALSDLDARAKVSKDGKTVTLVLPHAKLSDVTLDLDRSKVIGRNRGLANRLGSVLADSPTSERDVQIAGRKKLAAAAADSELLDRAEHNTKAMLTNLLETSGADRVVVTFGEPDTSGTPQD